MSGNQEVEEPDQHMANKTKPAIEPPRCCQPSLASRVMSDIVRWMVLRLVIPQQRGGPFGSTHFNSRRMAPRTRRRPAKRRGAAPTHAPQGVVQSSRRPPAAHLQGVGQIINVDAQLVPGVRPDDVPLCQLVRHLACQRLRQPALRRSCGRAGGWREGRVGRGEGAARLALGCRV